jgi:hypothetical protein
VTVYAEIQAAWEALHTEKRPAPVCSCGAIYALHGVYKPGWTCVNGHPL